MYVHCDAYFKKLKKEANKIPKEILEKMLDESEKEGIIYLKKLEKILNKTIDKLIIERDEKIKNPKKETKGGKKRGRPRKLKNYN